MSYELTNMTMGRMAEFAVSCRCGANEPDVTMFFLNATGYRIKPLEAKTIAGQMYLLYAQHMEQSRGWDMEITNLIADRFHE